MKTKIVGLIIIFLAVTFGAPTYFYFVRAKAHAQLDREFRQDLTLLTLLSELRITIRKMGNSVDKYLTAGDDQWFAEWHNVLNDAREINADLARLINEPSTRGTWDAVIVDFDAFVAEEERLIGLRRKGQLPVGEAAKMIAFDSKLDDVLQEILKLRKIGMEHLHQRQRDVQRASLESFLGLLSLFLVMLLTMGAFVIVQFVKPIQKELELGKLKTQLVAMVSHEFGNAINVIQGAAFVLKNTEGKGSKETRENFYEMLNISTRTLSIALNNLLNMGRLESGKFALDKKPIIVRDVIRECLRYMELIGQKKGIQFVLDLPEAPIPVEADPDALMLVISNLLGNAIKYTPQNGRVTVGVARSAGGGRQVEISVADTGIGISGEDRKKIFFGYYRTESGKNAAKGFGLGLHIVKQILDAHGTSLQLQSEVGRGSRFSFQLPVIGE